MRETTRLALQTAVFGAWEDVWELDVEWAVTFDDPDYDAMVLAYELAGLRVLRDSPTRSRRIAELRAGGARLLGRRPPKQPVPSDVEESGDSVRVTDALAELLRTSSAGLLFRELRNRAEASGVAEERIIDGLRLLRSSGRVRLRCGRWIAA
jgi:hypothetical protein